MKSTISILGALAMCLSLTTNVQLNNQGGMAFDSSGSQSRRGAFANSPEFGSGRSFQANHRDRVAQPAQQSRAR